MRQDAVGLQALLRGTFEQSGVYHASVEDVGHRLVAEAVALSGADGRRGAPLQLTTTPIQLGDVLRLRIAAELDAAVKESSFAVRVLATSSECKHVPVSAGGATAAAASDADADGAGAGALHFVLSRERLRLLDASRRKTLWKANYDQATQATLDEERERRHGAGPELELHMRSGRVLSLRCGDVHARDTALLLVRVHAQRHCERLGLRWVGNALAVKQLLADAGGGGAAAAAAGGGGASARRPIGTAASPVPLAWLGAESSPSSGGPPSTPGDSPGSAGADAGGRRHSFASASAGGFVGRERAMTTF